MLNTSTKTLLFVLFIGFLSLRQTKAQFLAEFAIVSDSQQESEKPNFSNAVRELEKFYKVSIAYQTNLMDDTWSGDFSPQWDKDIEENLQLLLTDSDLKFQQGKGDFYFLHKMERSEKANSSEKALLQKPVAYGAVLQEIEGVVVDEEGIPIPGASILVKGYMHGSVTDLDGKFTLEIEGEPADKILLVSFIGFVTKEIQVGTKTMFNITLESSTMALGEVVVTAFGLERDKKALGYTVQSVNGRELTEAQQPNVVNSLSGRVAGVQINGNSMPGSGSHVVIRGSSSVAGGNQPLVVVDGVPLEQTSSRNYGNGLSEINPENMSAVSGMEKLADVTSSKKPSIWVWELTYWLFPYPSALW